MPVDHSHSPLADNGMAAKRSPCYLPLILASVYPSNVASWKTPSEMEVYPSSWGKLSKESRIVQQNMIDYLMARMFLTFFKRPKTAVIYKRLP